MEGTFDCNLESLSAGIYELPGEPAVVINGVPNLTAEDGNINQGILTTVRLNKSASDVMTEFDKETGWYRVVYEDGDFEDLEWHELQEVLQPLDITMPLKSLALKIIHKNQKSEPGIETNAVPERKSGIFVDSNYKMIGEQCNEETQIQTSEISSHIQVLTETSNFNNFTSEDEFVNQTSCSKNFTFEVGYAAETLLRMANDVSFSSINGDFESDFVVKHGRNFRGIKGVGRKLDCLRNDDCELLSNSLNAFRRRKQMRKIELGCSYCGSTHLGTSCDDGNKVDDCERTSKMLYRKCRNEVEDNGGDLITPTVHRQFSFTIIHLMSAVRLALVAPSSNGSLSCDKFAGNDDSKANFPSIDHQGLSMDEIVEQVRLRPGDSRILQVEAQLEDLIRGTLRVFSSDSPPYGAKRWRKLAIYDKSQKGWRWVGPIPCLTSEQDDGFTACAPKIWGLPKNMLVKMVDCFADWFEINLNALKQRANLPPPPLSMSLCKINFKERFSRHLKGKGCSPTIKPCIGEIRAYFRAEERVRYMIPDWAYAYTAADGRKSSVAPVRKCGEKISSRARDHNLLKCDRPASITILTIVRDAAARLPGGIGIRGDVAVLVRDSQYLVEGISDEQMGQVVSGGLDRLHYERDPCVRFDRQRRLWVYLHGDREEEDFDDADGISKKDSSITRISLVPEMQISSRGIKMVTFTHRTEWEILSMVEDRGRRDGGENVRGDLILKVGKSPSISPQN
uniref:Uncharacterized protein n=1 Tax=Chenopodium quinoa TaxID=63459 RepID=A0A803NCV9_CHEQI